MAKRKTNRGRDLRISEMARDLSRQAGAKISPQMIRRNLIARKVRELGFDASTTVLERLYPFVRDAPKTAVKLYGAWKGREISGRELLEIIGSSQGNAKMARHHLKVMLRSRAEFRRLLSESSTQVDHQTLHVDGPEG